MKSKIALALLLISVVSVASAQKVSKISLTANSVAGGATATGTVEISAKAGTTGVVVTLSSSHSSATVPASVTIASGQTTATFNVTTLAVAVNTPSVLKATLGKSSESTSLSVEAPKASELVFVPTSIQGGTVATGTVKISSAAPVGGIKVTLATKTTAWGGPASIIVPAGATSASFALNTVPVDSSTNADVVAELSGARAPATIVITPPVVSNFNLSTTSLIGGASATATLALSGPAPTGGFSVKLSSKSPDAKVPESVKVAAGATSATFTVTTKSVTGATTAVLVASAPGASIELSLAIGVVSVSRFAINNTSITGGTATSATLTLNAAAPAGGFTVSLSSNQSFVQVPATVTIPAGATSVTFAVTTSAVASDSTATISAATAGSSVPQTASLAVMTTASLPKKPPIGKG